MWVLKSKYQIWLLSQWVKWMMIIPFYSGQIQESHYYSIMSGFGSVKGERSLGVESESVIKMAVAFNHAVGNTWKSMVRTRGWGGAAHPYGSHLGTGGENDILPFLCSTDVSFGTHWKWQVKGFGLRISFYQLELPRVECWVLRYQKRSNKAADQWIRTSGERWSISCLLRLLSQQVDQEILTHLLSNTTSVGPHLTSSVALV